MTRPPAAASLLSVCAQVGRAVGTAAACDHARVFRGLVLGVGAFGKLGTLPMLMLGGATAFLPAALGLGGIARFVLTIAVTDGVKSKQQETIKRCTEAQTEERHRLEDQIEVLERSTGPASSAGSRETVTTHDQLVSIGSLKVPRRPVPPSAITTPTLSASLPGEGSVRRAKTRRLEGNSEMRLSAMHRRRRASAKRRAIVRRCDVCFSLGSRRSGSVCDGHLQKATNDVNTLRPQPFTRPLITGAMALADNARPTGSPTGTDAQAPSENEAEGLESARADVARQISVIEQALNHSESPDAYSPPDLSPLASSRNAADIALLRRCKESESAIRQAQRWHLASEIADNGLGWMFVAGAASLITPSAVVLSPFVCLMAAMVVQGRAESAFEKVEKVASGLEDARNDLEKSLVDIDRQLEAVALRENAEALHKRLNPSEEAPPPIQQTEQAVSIGSVTLPKRPNGSVHPPSSSTEEMGQIRPL